MSPRRSNRRPLRLPARYAVILMPLILSLMMTCIISAIATLRSLGPSPEFLALWPGAWALSWLIAFPTLLVILPLVRRLVGMLVLPPEA